MAPAGSRRLILEMGVSIDGFVATDVYRPRPG